MENKNSFRTLLIEGELNKTEEDYIQARKAFEQARIEMETAKEKFKSVKKLAAEMLSPEEWLKWHRGHIRTRMVGMTIGEAITMMLHLYTASCARKFVDDPTTKFDPSVPVDHIMNWLEEGGFEFQSATPGRELNAALMRLKDIAKTDTGNYAMSNANVMIEKVKLLRMKRSKENA